MLSLSEMILPELTMFESGPERQKMLLLAISGPRTHAFAFLIFVGGIGLFILWDKMVTSVPSKWSLLVVPMLCLIGFGMAMGYTRRDIRRRLREQLVKKGIPICIPCGYNLTGNESGVCPECGTGIAETRSD